MHWVQLVHQCVSTVSYKILINGEMTQAFQPTCGLRQGDPLSPYLFLFCMDIISRMTALATEISQFQGIQVHRRAPTISHLFFADDSMFFFNASPQSCHAVATVINRFCNISGQVLNRHKSFVKFSWNVSREMQEGYNSILQIDTSPSLGTYLGTPIDIKGAKVSHFTPLLDKVSRKLSLWSHTHIFQPAKIIVINTILVGALIH